MSSEKKGDKLQCKEVLIPTDFSPCALSALRCAISWNNNDPVSVHLYHRVAGMPSHWNDMSEGEQDTYTGVLNAIDTLHKRYESYRTVLNEREIPHKLVYSGGELGDGIVQYVGLEAIDYVFMGSHGKVSRKHNKLGSNAIEAIKRLEIPVLVAKEYIIDQNFKDVVFASSFDLSASDAFDTLLEAIRPFKPTIHLLNIDTPAVFSSPKFITIDAMRDFQSRAIEFETVLHFHPDINVGRGIVDFCEHNKIDLIALSESGSSLFGAHKVPNSVKYLIEKARQPMLFV